jgi:hypothetical protein
MNDVCVEVARRLACGERLGSHLRAHTDYCGSCASLLRRFALAEKLLAMSGSAPPWFTERALARIRRRKLAEAFLREPFPWKWVVLGMALGAAALGFWTLAGVPAVDVRPLGARWVLDERHLATIEQAVRGALPALAALALSILPFLIPARAKTLF